MNVTFQLPRLPGNELVEQGGKIKLCVEEVESASWVPQKWVKSNEQKEREKERRKRILQGLGMVQAGRTERWP